MYDTMNYIKPDVVTICYRYRLHLMGAFLLSSGAKGKPRFWALTKLQGISLGFPSSPFQVGTHTKGAIPNGFLPISQGQKEGIPGRV